MPFPRGARHKRSKRGQISDEDALPFMRMLTNSLGLLLMERRVLYAEKTDSADTQAYARWLVGMLRGWLLSRRAAPLSPSPGGLR